MRNEMTMGSGRRRWLYAVLTLLAVQTTSEALATDWTGWRGPEMNGVSRETGLPDRFTRSGENVVWKADQGGRSTPIVMNGHLYVLNSTGEGVSERERLMCFDAETGQVLWERSFSVFLTDIVSNRLGWSSPAGDPETGYVYVHGAQSAFICFDFEGNVVWRRSLGQEFGVITGYGGRIPTPIVDGDLVIVGFLNSSWGAFGKGGQRYVAFDKRTGSVVWWSEPGGQPLDTTYTAPVIGVINGVRLLIDGGADGAVHALKVATGEPVWSFGLSKRGINASVVLAGNKVIACHSEENIDGIVMGRVVCIDATGSGDVTKTHELWRADGLLVGYSSPALHEGVLYACDNSANLFAIDVETGKTVWTQRLGTVMKASPVVADGKIYIGEVNARFLILRAGRERCEILSETTFDRPDGTVVEINGSAAVANGRVYFCTRDEVYCLGQRPWKGTSGALPVVAQLEPPGADAVPAWLQVTPADVVLQPGGSVLLTARLFDARGRFLKEQPAAWSLKGLQGKVGADGRVSVSAEAPFQGGMAEAKVAGLTGAARIRVVPSLPYTVDFSAYEDGKPPPGWLGAGAKFLVHTLDGEKVLRKVSDNPRFVDAQTVMGVATGQGYTIATDFLGTEKRRNMPNVTLVNNGYQLLLMGNQQRLRIVSWLAKPRLDATVSYGWKPGVWYRMKFRVELGGEGAKLRGKVWPRAEKEPEGWNVSLDDPSPNEPDPPAIQAYSAGVTSRSGGAELYFDNVSVSPNEGA